MTPPHRRIPGPRAIPAGKFPECAPPGPPNALPHHPHDFYHLSPPPRSPACDASACRTRGSQPAPPGPRGSARLPIVPPPHHHQSTITILHHTPTFHIPPIKVKRKK